MSIIAIFKNGERFTQDKRPKIGQKCFYCPGVWLVPDVFVPDYRTCIKPYIKPLAICEVTGATEHLAIVKFGDQEETNLISPDFLVAVELTAVGKELFNDILGEKCKPEK